MTAEEGGYGGASEMVDLLRAFGGALAPEPLLEAAVVPSVLLAMTAPPPAHPDLLQKLIEGGCVLVAADCPVSPCTVKLEIRADAVVLSGTVTHVLAADCATHFTLRGVDVASGRPRVLVVRRDTPGIEVRAAHTIDARTAGTLTLESAKVPADALCPGEDASSALDAALNMGLLGQSACMVGILERMFGLTRDYLGTRKQFGQPLAAFQALRHRLADMYAELFQARALLAATTERMAGSNLTDRAPLVSSCKVRVARAARLIGAQALQLHGAIGLTEEYAVGRCFKRLMVLEKTWGDGAQHVGRYLETRARMS